MKKSLITLCLCIAFFSSAFAQLSKNPDKFLGNITTRGSVNGGGIEYSTLWNQITPENESKWASCEGSRNNFNWGGCDNAYNYAKNHNFPFKFHTLVWGSQFPSWFKNLSKEERYKEIVEWMDAVKKRYPNLDMIDVVNEAITGHQADTPLFIEALGGTGKSGYDWIIKAFEMAAERWPNAILIYNDFNTFQWQKAEFIALVKALRDYGAPIDAYGCQSHDLTDMGLSAFKSAMSEIQTALKIPMYSTEYDIGTSDDAKQLQQYKDQIKYMWEQPYVAGVTLWGYIYGATWTTDGNSGIIRNGVDRPAMTWLREYMASDAAKTAKSPFPGMKKEASLYVKPRNYIIPVNEETTLNITARLRTKTLDKVEVYISNTLVATLTEAPAVVKYTPTTTGVKVIKTILYDTEGNKYERTQGLNVTKGRSAYNNTPATVPGTIEFENFDTGADGIAFHDTNTTREGNAASYRTDSGIDIIKVGTDGYAVGYTKAGEWMEYTVDVKEAGYYECDIYAANNTVGAQLQFALSDGGDLTSLIDNFNIPKVGVSMHKLHGRFAIPLEVGKQVIRVTVVEGGMGIDKMELHRVDINNDINISLTANPTVATEGEEELLHADVSSATASIKSVDFYANNQLIETVTSQPYEATFTPATNGTCHVKAIATDANGMRSQVAEKTLTVKKQRKAYAGVIEIPGTIEFENFDIGEEGMTYHDSDANDEGKCGFRTDNGGVDILQGSTGYIIGYTKAEEWLEYTVNVAVGGKYTFEAIVASPNTGTYMFLGTDVSGTMTNIGRINVPNTGGWSNYQTVTGSIIRKVDAGRQTFRITFKGGDSNLVNVDKIKLICSEPDGIDEVISLEPATYEIYNASGIRLGRVQAAGNRDLRSKVAQMTRNGKELIVVRNAENGETVKLR